MAVVCNVGRDEISGKEQRLLRLLQFVDGYLHGAVQCCTVEVEVLVAQLLQLAHLRLCGDGKYAFDIAHPQLALLLVALSVAVGNAHGNVVFEDGVAAAVDSRVGQGHKAKGEGSCAVGDGVAKGNDFATHP